MIETKKLGIFRNPELVQPASLPPKTPLNSNQKRAGDPVIPLWPRDEGPSSSSFAWEIEICQTVRRLPLARSTGNVDVTTHNWQRGVASNLHTPNHCCFTRGSCDCGPLVHLTFRPTGCVSRLHPCACVYVCSVLAPLLSPFLHFVLHFRHSFIYPAVLFFLFFFFFFFLNRPRRFSNRWLVIEELSLDFLFL